MVFNFNCVVFQTLVHFVSIADSYGELSPMTPSYGGALAIINKVI